MMAEKECSNKIMNIALKQLTENEGEIKYQSYYLFVLVLFMFIIDIGHTLTNDWKVAKWWE